MQAQAKERTEDCSYRGEWQTPGPLSSGPVALRRYLCWKVDPWTMRTEPPPPTFHDGLGWHGRTVMTWA